MTDTVKEVEYLLGAIGEELKRQGYRVHAVTVERNCCADLVVGTATVVVTDRPILQEAVVFIEQHDRDVEVQHPVRCIMESNVPEEIRSAITEHLTRLDIENGVSFKLTSP